MSMQEMRVVEFPFRGWKFIKKFDDPPLSMISVAVQELAAPVVLALEFGVPEPIRVIPTLAGGTRFEAHVHIPAGTLMISPSTAVWIGPLMTAFTSE
jgi:hypothetical protein